MRILRNGYTVKPAGGSSAWTDGSAASTLLLGEFFGPPAVSATVTATEAADTLTAMATITQPAVEAPVVQPISSGGGGGTRARVARDQTYLVFSDDGPRPVSQEEPPRGLSTAEAPAAGDNASRPSAAAPSPETVAALASTLAGQVEIAALPAMPELIAGNDDEEAMMIILALAA